MVNIGFKAQKDDALQEEWSNDSIGEELLQAQMKPVIIEWEKLRPACMM